MGTAVLSRGKRYFGDDMEDRQIPYFAHEADMARMERSNKRLWIVIIIAIALLFVSNAIWLYEWTSYDMVLEGEEVDVNAENGIANYVGNDGDISGDNVNGKN